MAKVPKKLLKVLDKVNFAEQNRSQFCVKKYQLRYLFSSENWRTPLRNQADLGAMTG